jgi:hypothetical protein
MLYFYARFRMKVLQKFCILTLLHADASFSGHFWNILMHLKE